MTTDAHCFGRRSGNTFPIHPATLAIGGIPYTNGYNVYVYFDNNQSAQNAMILLQSGGYTSPTYYVSTLGKQSATASPFFISGTLSTAGTYTASNYVQFPVPAEGISGAGAACHAHCGCFGGQHRTVNRGGIQDGSAV